MTNKTKTILCVCALTASAFAWNATAAEDVYEGYGVYDNNYVTHVAGHPEVYYSDAYNLYRGAWHIEGRGEGVGATGETTTFTSIVDDAVLSLSLERNGNTNPFQFGTFTYNEDNSVNRSEALGSVKGKGDLGLSFYNTDTFSKGELVGIWIQELDKAGNPIGDIYYSDNSVTLTQAGVANGQYTDGYVDGTANDEAYGRASVWFDIANNGVWGGQNVDGVELGLTEILFHVTGAAPSEAGKVGTGGPLPGVWATIALAGAASAYLKRRKKENK